jgi:hypothetical protein
MYSKSLEIQNLATTLSALPIAHNSFGPLIGDVDVRLELWVLRYKESGAWVLRVVYGMVSLLKAPLSSDWGPSKFKNLYDSSEIERTFKKPQVGKIGITLKGWKAVEVSQKLFEGKALGTVASELGLPNVNSNYSDLKLGIHGLPKSEFVFRPPVTGLPENVLRAVPDDLKGSGSPIKDAVTMVAALFRTDKTLLWRMQNGELIPGAEELLKKLVEYLALETGLSFHGSDFKRLGNIEWVAYPSKDAQEQSLCKVTTQTQIKDAATGTLRSPEDFKRGLAGTIVCEGVQVEILVGAFHAFSEIIVQCLSFNGNDLLSDQCKAGRFPSDRQFDFRFYEPISESEVKVYKKEPDEDRWTLWHQERFNVLRQIEIQMRIGNPKTPKSPWLDNLLSPTGGKFDAKRPPAEFSFGDQGVLRFPFDPWNPIGRNMDLLKGKINPAASSAVFIRPSGKSDEERSALIADWLTKVCNIHKAQTCLIVDPYFSSLGVDVLLRVNASETELVVVTNSQCQSIDAAETDQSENSEASKSPGAEPKESNPETASENVGDPEKEADPTQPGNSEPGKKSRADVIKEYCMTNEERLRNRGIRILDLQTVSGTQKRIFHDRYVLFWDKDGRLFAGYNLSNSIQKAMVNYPLLITPLPDDVLDPIEEYVRHEIQNNAILGTRKIETLYQPPIDSPRPLVPLKALEAITQPGKLFSFLMPGKVNEATGVPEIVEALKSNGVFLEPDEFNLSSPSISLQEIVSRLSGLSSGHFKEVWMDLGEVLARSHQFQEFNTYMEKNDKLKKLLRELLLDDDLRKQHIGITGSSLEQIRENYNLRKSDVDFVGSLNIANLFQKYGLRGLPLLGPYSISMAVGVLEAVDPEGLVEVVDTVFQRKDWTETDLFLMDKAFDGLHRLVSFKPSERLITALCQTSTLWMKALAATALFQNVPPLEVTKRFEPFMGHFTNEEQILIFSDWIHGVYVRSTQKGGASSVENEMLRKSLIGKILQLFPTGNTALFKKLIWSCDGRSEGWSLLNYQEIGLELIKSAKCSLEDATQIWLDPLIEKIQKSPVSEYHFNVYVDVQATTVAAHLLLSFGDRKKQEYFSKIRKIHEDLLEWLNRGRIKSIDSSGWFYRINTLVWLQVLFKVLLSMDGFDGSTPGYSDISSDYSIGDSFLMKIQELQTICGEHLYAWWDRVKRL